MVLTDDQTALQASAQRFARERLLPHDQRDRGNRAIGEWLAWVGTLGAALSPNVAQRAWQLLREAMRTETEIELKHSPRPLFAEMSGGG